MKLHEVLQEENIGKVFRFKVKDGDDSEEYVLLNQYSQVELFSVEEQEYDESRIEDKYYLKVILEGDFEVIDEYGDFEE